MSNRLPAIFCLLLHGTGLWASPTSGLLRVLLATRAISWWFNADQGGIAGEGTIEVTGRQNFKAPFDEAAALYLKKQSE